MKLSDLTTERWDTLSELRHDPECGLAVAKHIGNAIARSDQIVEDMPFEQVLCLLSRAAFAASEDECACVARMFMHVIRKTDVLPLVTVHSGIELSSRCLVSLSLFIRALETRCRRRGAPAPCFYREQGIKCCRLCDMEDVAEHFSNWEGFIGEQFVA
jgi:hypothetical protein